MLPAAKSSNRCSYRTSCSIDAADGAGPDRSSVGLAFAGDAGVTRSPTPPTAPRPSPTAPEGRERRAARPSAARSRDAGRPRARRRRPGPRAARCSKRMSSPSIRSRTAGSSTKNPPFTQAPSPTGFSWKARTPGATTPPTISSSSISRDPKRPSGWTAVIVASLPCARWNSSELRDVDVGDAVAVGQHEGVVADVLADSLDPAAGLRLGSGVDERHPPRLGGVLVDHHRVVAHVEGHVGHVQEVVREVLLDHVALVAEAHDEVAEAVVAVASS